MRALIIISFASTIMIFSLSGCYTMLQRSDNYSQSDQAPYYYPPLPEPCPPEPIQPIIIIYPPGPIEQPEYKIRPVDSRPKYDGSYGDRDPIRKSGERGSDVQNNRGQ